VRVTRGGVAIMQTMLSREGLAHVRAAHREGRLEPTV